MLPGGSNRLSPRTPSEQKIGDFFHACTDESSIEKAGLTPI